MEPEAQGGGRGGEVHGAAVDEHLPGVGVLRALGQERRSGDTSQTCQASYTISSSCQTFYIMSDMSDMSNILHIIFTQC